MISRGKHLAPRDIFHLPAHPRPESSSAPHSMIFEDQLWPKLTKAPCVDEVRISISL